MAKLDKFPDPPRAQGRTAHDMSHDFKFTCSNGMILPVEHDILLPGDTAYLKFHFFGRNYLDFLAPAMADVDFHVDYFFVPMMMLFTPFGSWERGVNDEYSSNWLGNPGTPTTKLQINQIKLPLIDSEASRAYFYAARNYHYYPKMSEGVIPEGGAPLLGEGMHVESVGREYCRLMDMIGMNPYLDQNEGFNPNVFPYALLTYQCIWQKYFRLEDREDYLPYFNWDVLHNLPTLALTDPAPYPVSRNPEFKQIMLANLYRLHYRPSNFDYFTSVKKSPLLNDQNLQKINFQQGNPSMVFGPSMYGEYASFPGTSDGYQDGDTTLFHDPNSFKQVIPQTNLTDEQGGLAQLRQLFAIDKVMQVSARARKSYDAQIYAHFGFKVPHDVKHDLTHIKHESATLHIGQVISTGDTESLGARAGVGMVSMESKGIKFTAPCHGVLMVTFSSSVRYDYQVPFLRKNFIQTRLDFWQPEFDHLGMQPVYLFETTFMGKEVTGSHSFDSDVCAFDVQGWTYRYAEKKRNINRITQAFGHDPYPSSDLPQTLASYVPWQRPYHGVTFGHYFDADDNVVKEGNYQYASDSMAFLSYPSDLDGMFSAIYDNSFPADLTNMANLYVRDQFIIASRIEYKKVSQMSTYSMPKLD